MLYIHYRRTPLILCMLSCFPGCMLAYLTGSAAEANEIALAKQQQKNYSSPSKAIASKTRNSTKMSSAAKTKVSTEHLAKTRVTASRSSPKLHATKIAVPKVLVSKPLPSRTMTVREWFDKYDEIRRDAEMTMADKWQSMLLQARKPEPKNAALAKRMSSKYSRALSAMKRLGSPPETKALQVGYIEYFSTARQLFEDYLVAQNAVPFTNQSLVPTKKKLEVLDKRNKQIDDVLRREYFIKKHRHS